MMAAHSLLAVLDVVALSRLQFALTIMFHYIFPPLTIGLGAVLVWLGLRGLVTGDPAFRQAHAFWTKVFALNFAIGVATGIVMEFQFGTNWAVYSEFVGDVFGSALAAEGIFAFFLESGFLAVLVFGRERVGPRMHFASTVMVFLGSCFSAVWIIVANSWQQTPAGSHVVQVVRNGLPWVVDGRPVLRAEVVDFWRVVFNPTSMIRLAHTLTGAFIVGGALVCSIGAWYLLRGRFTEFAKRSLNGGLIVLTLGAFSAGLTGHVTARLAYAYQPAKMSAMEGHFHNGRGDLTVFGWPDEKAGVVRGDIAIPGGYSFLLSNHFDTKVVGLDEFPRKEWPPVLPVFLVFRVMVGIGTYLIGLSVAAAYFRWRGTLFQQRWLLWMLVATIFPALLANHAGWVTAEIGRQPWVVYPSVQWTGGAPGVGDVVTGADGLVHYDEVQALRTADAVSRSVTGGQVLTSIIGFGLVYILLGTVWAMALNARIQSGPEPTGGPAVSGDALQGYLDAASNRPDRTGSLTGRHAATDRGTMEARL